MAAPRELKKFLDIWPECSIVFGDFDLPWVRRAFDVLSQTTKPLVAKNSQLITKEPERIDSSIVRESLSVFGLPAPDFSIR